MNDDDIVFAPQSRESVRVELNHKAIDRVRQRIFKSCKNNCDNGFIEQKKKIEKIEDLAYSSAVECSCRKKADLFTKYVYSGIPVEYFLSKNHDYKVDSKSQSQLNLYMKKLDAAMVRGIGISFFAARVKINSELMRAARKAIALGILMKLIKMGYTGHYMHLEQYYTIMLSLVHDRNEHSIRFQKEIMDVDFLVVEGVETITRTDFKKIEIEKLVRHRRALVLPTFYISQRKVDDLSETVPYGIWNTIKETTMKVEFTECSSKIHKKNFIDVGKDLEE